MYKPIFTITATLLRHISLSSEIKAWLSGALVDVSWLPRMQIETAARLAHSSTAIEGNPLTLPEVEALARGEKIGGEEKAKREILNYLAALRWIWKRRVGSGFKEKELLHLHSLITEGLIPLSGRYKTNLNRVVDSRGHTVYTPPPPTKSKVLTVELLKWLNSVEAENLHPIIVCAIAHHKLVSIHPFSDGNGRTARALGIWILYSRGFDTFHLFSLDEYFQENRNKYYQKIQQARDLDDDLSYWLEYVAEGVSDTLSNIKERISSLQITAPPSKILLTKRQEDFLRFLRDRGRAQTGDFEKAFKISRTRVNQVLKPLVNAGIVIQTGATRATAYHLAPKI